MTTSSAEQRHPLPAIVLPGTRRPAVQTYLWPVRPALVDRSARAWWLAFGCWFVGSSVGQLLHGPAAVGFGYRYTSAEPGLRGLVSYDRLDAWSMPGPLAVVLFGLTGVFLASLVLPMRDGARWARLLLTVLAAPVALVLVLQIGRSLFFDPVNASGVVQGLLCVVALCAVPYAVGTMYRPAARAHFDAVATPG